jgi:hypothetical protein
MGFFAYRNVHKMINRSRVPTPAAVGWMRLRNSTNASITVIVEPWGIGPQIDPQDECLIFIEEKEPYLPILELSEGVVQVWGSVSAVQVNGVITHDFSK